MDVKNIAEISLEETKEFFNSFDSVVFDCDGVLWHINHILPGVKECLSTLKKLGKGIKYVTNNSVRPMDNYKEMFNQLDIELDENDLMHPARAIVEYLKEINFTGLIYCIGSTVFKANFTDAGFELIDGPMELMPESFSHAVKVIREPKPVKAVIVDVDFNNCHAKVARAAFLLNDPNVLFIAGASDCRLPLTKNVSILGPGYFNKIIEEHTGRKAMAFSKPSKRLAEKVISIAGERCLFVGDMLEQDMGFANDCKYKKLLVLSGGTCSDELKELPENSEYKPDYFGESLQDLLTAAQKLL
uniref:CSON009800 protein n=1 Tax=Culicoides sonorensis TaxID=179676 RepID=A0A336M100_CULSO